MTSANPTTDPKVTPELVAKHGVTPEEFERINKFSAASPIYRARHLFGNVERALLLQNSRRELKKFPTTGPNILVKAGEENAGVVDIGEGWAIAFKMESHNHPSAIEPFQARPPASAESFVTFHDGRPPEFC